MKPLDIPCGVCHQPAGKPCLTIASYGDRPHAVRKAAAKRGNKPPHSKP